MSRFTRFWMAACVAGLALAPASRVGAGERKGNAALKLVPVGLPTVHARAATALGKLGEAIASNSPGRARPADIEAAQQAIASAKSGVWGLSTDAAAEFADALEGAMAKSGVPGTSHAAAAGTVTWKQQHGEALHVRLGLGDGSRGQPEVVIRADQAGTHPVISLRTGTWEVRPGEILTGQQLAAQRHIKQTVVFASRGLSGNERGPSVRRLPGHVGGAVR